MIALSIDVGSTWTKGASFSVDRGRLVLLEQATRPTSIADLSEGFGDVLGTLTGSHQPYARLREDDVRLFYSSSAKGGLEVAALGLVPDITLESARIAACSAGAKVTRAFSYRLTRSDVRALEKTPPDIVLFTGGTDGGNADTVLANAEMLSRSALDCSIIYAGNRSIRDDIAECLAGKDLALVDNVLPTMDQPNPEPAREAIRSVFLSKIVKGKGLDRIVESTGVEPVPTPYSVYEYVKTISSRVEGWNDFVLLDMGGATTDVYSAHLEDPEPGTVLRGLPEPGVKRTVEGDLGLRVSAAAAAASVGDLIGAVLEAEATQMACFQDYVTHLMQHPDYLPENTADRHFDEILAGACMAQAVTRHVGRSSEVFTADGKIRLQTGRDLSKVRRVIGSGGWLATADSFDPGPWFECMKVDARGRAVLLPRQFDYFRDEQYLFPLLANVAREFPVEAANAGIAALAPQK